MSSGPFKLDSYEWGEIGLRRLTADDAARIGGAFAEIDPWARMEIGADALAAHLSKDDPALNRFVIVVEDAIAGAACIREPWLKGPYLELLGILPGFQRKGSGGKVMQWFEAEAVEAINPAEGHLNLWLLVSNFNDAAMSFYERQGYSRAAPLPDLARPGFTEILMRKVV